MILENKLLMKTDNLARFFCLFFTRFVTKEVVNNPVVIPLAVDFGCMFRDQSPTGDCKMPAT